MRLLSSSGRVYLSIMMGNNGSAALIQTILKSNRIKYYASKECSKSRCL